MDGESGLEGLDGVAIELLLDLNVAELLPCLGVVGLALDEGGEDFVCLLEVAAGGEGLGSMQGGSGG